MAMETGRKPTIEPQSDMVRIKYGFVLVVLGICLVTLAFALSLLKLSASADVAAAMGSVTTVIGTLVGTYFGHQAGAAGREIAERRRDQAQTLASTALAALPSEQRHQVIQDARKYQDYL